MTLNGDWKFRQAGTAEWLPAQVPGGVHTDLMASGRLADPFVADNEAKAQWVAEADWEYCREFWMDRLPDKDERCWLVCEGLDTLAEISLNGRPLACTDNMFRAWRFDLAGRLVEGANLLAVTFRSPLARVAAAWKDRPLTHEATSLRKAPCHFGWDWGPRLPAIGIWKDIRLETRALARLASVRLSPSLDGGEGRLRAELEAEAWTETALQATIRLEGPDGSRQETTVPIIGGRGVLELAVASVRLWWPNGYGEQALYQAEICLTAGGRVLDRCRRQVGFRELRLDQSPDRWGHAFSFVVNGVPVFAKGANWIPADSFPTRVTRERLEHLLVSAAATHQNMIRVWGGGSYESEDFYDLCDRLGLLVWQDMMFACSIYPVNEAAFREQVEIEIREQLRRLRHRACIALWCGDNEQETAWEHWEGWDTPERRELKQAYHEFIYGTMPAWFAEEDPERTYWPSSPSSHTPGRDSNGEAQGDMHYWEVWHKRKPFSAYRTQFPRFMSEFGFQSLPTWPTVEHFLPDEGDRNISSFVMEQHQKSPVGNGLIISQLLENYRLPRDFPALVHASQVLQAEGIRSGTEHWRRHRGRVGGVIYWQLNDCWPVASWSGIDSFGRWKALHYAARHFFDPVLLSVKDEGARLAFHLTNDLPQDWRGRLDWTLETLDGTRLDGGGLEVQAPALADRCLFDRDFAGQLGGAERRRAIVTAELREADGRLRRSLVQALVPTKHLELARPTLTSSLMVEHGELALTVGSDVLARFVELGFAGWDLVFSDNFFDLPAGRHRTVRARLPAGADPAEAAGRLCLRSLADGF